MTNYNIHNKQDELNYLIQQLKTFAVMHSVPMFLTCAVENNDDETVYRTDALSPAATNRILKDNKFTDLINVMNGASTYYISENTDQILDAMKSFSENESEEYSEFTSLVVDEDDFYSEE